MTSDEAVRRDKTNGGLACARGTYASQNEIHGTNNK